MDELKEKLGEDLFKQVTEKLGEDSLSLVPKGKKAFLHGEDEKPIISNNGEWVPASKLSEVTEAKKALADQNTELSKSLEEMKKNAKGNEDLTKQINDLQTKVKDFETSQTKLEKKYILRDQLSDVQAKKGYIDLLESKFDLDKLEVIEEGGKKRIKDFETHVKPFQENYKDLFGEEKIEGAVPGSGDNKLPENILSMEQIKGMSQAEVSANLKQVNESLDFHGTNK